MVCISTALVVVIITLDTRSYSIAQAGLDLTMQSRLVSYSPSLIFSNTGIPDTCHLPQFDNLCLNTPYSNSPSLEVGSLRSFWLCLVLGFFNHVRASHEGLAYAKQILCYSATSAAWLCFSLWIEDIRLQLAHLHLRGPQRNTQAKRLQNAYPLPTR